MVTQRKDINILLLGQTGVGKSTFINALYNYLFYKDINDALNATDTKYCVSMAFDWFLDTCNTQRIIIGANKNTNECLEIGKSATQNIKSHLFEFNNVGIRVIDTPGFGDTDGIEKDKKICENLLNFLSIRNELQELNAIIFLLKPDDNRTTTFFKYCLDEIFSKLPRSSCKNIVFVFTHTYGTNYKPGPALGLLKKEISKFPDIIIPCDKPNIFCMENDCIRYLFTAQFNRDIEFDTDIKIRNTSIWNHSSRECLRLINYIKSLPPHSMQDTIAINSAGYYSLILKTQLPIILEHTKDKINQCRKHEEDIIEAEADKESLRNVLYSTTTIKREGKYHIVCHNRNCRKKETHGKNKKACCPNCKAWKIIFCQKFKKSTCEVCGCDKLDHVFENNEDYAELNQTKNNEIDENINEKQISLNKKKLDLFKHRLIKKKYEAEKKYIDYSISKLGDYLKKTAITSNQSSGNIETSDNKDINCVKDIGKIFKDLINLELTGNALEKLLDKEHVPISAEDIYSIDREI